MAKICTIICMLSGSTAAMLPDVWAFIFKSSHIPTVNFALPALPPPVFSPIHTENEKRIVPIKYARATQYIHGLALAPLRLIPFADEYTTMQASTNNGSNTLIALENFGPKVFYDGAIGIGTPAQRFQMMFDTGSSVLWVVSDCSACNATNGHFSPSSSITFDPVGREASVDYGIGHISGPVAKDVVSIGNLSVKQQSFIAADDISENFEVASSRGLIGLAFSTTEGLGEPTWFESLMLARTVSAPLFSVYLTWWESSGSNICIGCIDHSKYIGEMVWLPVRRTSYWTVDMLGYSVNKGVVSPVQLIAALDTGSTNIYFPAEAADHLYSLIEGARPLPQYGPGYYSFPCMSGTSEDVSIDLVLGARTFQLSPASFNLGLVEEGSSECVGGILGIDGDEFSDEIVVLGTEFLHSYYTVFDYSHGTRVGLAKSNSIPEDIDSRIEGVL